MQCLQRLAIILVAVCAMWPALWAHDVLTAKQPHCSIVHWTVQMLVLHVTDSVEPASFSCKGSGHPSQYSHPPVTGVGIMACSSAGKPAYY